MKNPEFMTKASRALNRFGLQCKKYAPEAMVVVGVAGVVTSAVMACKATTKAGEITEELQEGVDQIHEAAALEAQAAKEDAEAEKAHIVKYTQEDQKKDTVIVYTQAAVKYIKLYAPSVALGVLSLGCILTSHNILRKRNIALAAAYTAVDKGFKEYRGRVVERFGKELDNELRYNIKAKQIEETVVDENGKETTVTKTVDVVDPNTHSIYARFFDDGCTGWTKDAELNLKNVICQQNYANELLKSRGYLFLNEAYDMFGIPRTAAGQQVGWLYDEENPTGDNFVDFGVFDIYNSKARDFVNGYERTILLDFNVDGYILDMI